MMILFLAVIAVTILGEVLRAMNTLVKVAQVGIGTKRGQN